MNGMRKKKTFFKTWISFSVDICEYFKDEIPCSQFWLLNRFVQKFNTFSFLSSHFSAHGAAITSCPEPFGEQVKGFREELRIFFKKVSNVFILLNIYLFWIGLCTPGQLRSILQMCKWHTDIGNVRKWFAVRWKRCCAQSLQLQLGRWLWNTQIRPWVFSVHTMAFLIIWAIN